MGCDFPIPAYRHASERTVTGKRALTFSSKNALDSSAETGKIEIPCGRCMGCKLTRSQEWASRLLHEASQHEFNAFITLTYDQQSVPQDYSLKLDHQQNFIKRLRSHAAYHHEGLKLRFYMCGEYGPENGRPHYHAAIFGYDFPDKVLFRTDQAGNRTYTSEILTDLWGMGHCTTGALDPQSASYIAQYVTKKVIGSKADDHYYRLSPIDGQFHSVRPEKATMSTRPGIGYGWLQKFHSDVFPSGFIVVDGQKRPVPRFYRKKLPEAEQASLKRDAIRRGRALRAKGETTDWRRHQRATVRDARISRLKRNSLEDMK